MRLLSFRDPTTGATRLGVLTGPSRVVDLHAASDGELPGDMRHFLRLGPAALARARTLAERPHSMTLELPGLRLLPTVPEPGKVLCVALNFQSHIDECQAHGQDFIRKQDFPLLSPKVPSALAAHRQEIVYPPQGRQLDYEVELAFVIGRTCRNARRRQWRDYVTGFTVSVDITLRDIAFRPLGLFEGKNYDGFLPLGPWLITEDEIADPGALHLSLSVNGEERQSESMASAFFDAGDVIEYWSARMTLEPGDVFTLGSPAGVGVFGADPERTLLHPGDSIEASISGIGTLANTIVALPAKGERA